MARQRPQKADTDLSLALRVAPRRKRALGCRRKTTFKFRRCRRPRQAVSYGIHCNPRRALCMPQTTHIPTFEDIWIWRPHARTGGCVCVCGVPPYMNTRVAGQHQNVDSHGRIRGTRRTVWLKPWPAKCREKLAELLQMFALSPIQVSGNDPSEELNARGLICFSLLDDVVQIADSFSRYGV